MCSVGKPADDNQHGGQRQTFALVALTESGRPESSKQKGSTVKSVQAGMPL